MVTAYIFLQIPFFFLFSWQSQEGRQAMRWAMPPIFFALMHIDCIFAGPSLDTFNRRPPQNLQDLLGFRFRLSWFNSSKHPLCQGRRNLCTIRCSKTESSKLFNEGTRRTPGDQKAAAHRKIPGNRPDRLNLSLASS
jgi:hypothetical protein